MTMKVSVMKKSSLMRPIKRLALITSASLLVLLLTTGFRDAVTHTSDSKTGGKDDHAP